MTTKTKITRRLFLRKGSLVGVTSVVGAWMIPEFLRGISLRDHCRKSGAVTPICQIKKELYVPSPEPRVGTSVSMSYIGRKLRREEIRSTIRSSDWADTIRRRTSEDNGKNWSEWELEYKEAPTQGEFTQEGGESQRGTGPYDPVSGRLIKPVFQRIITGKPEVAMKEIWKGNRLFCDHGFYQLSDDDGLTWGKAKQFKYENGPDFDPDNWGDSEYSRTNEMYIGQAIALSNGTVIISSTIPVPHRDEEDEKFPSVFPNDYRDGCVAGAVCFVGRWNKARQDYDWTKSKSVFLPRKKSTRGLVELNLSELKNGNLLLTMRGSNTGLDPLKYPGRRWFSISQDGGLSWSEVKDMCYDTGEQLYSPASIARTIRSSKTGKLYWVGNIPDVPPDGNSPRYPLQIVEIDEEGPSFKKDTVTVIDNRDPEKDSEHLQLSNFSLFENRETQEMEMYLIRLGEHGGGPDIWTADAYKYTLVF
ncbi:MAG: sialidase family protein [Bacteroidota bacterium]|nr:sialidase family protein [Bacteroidota bacterium]